MWKGTDKSKSINIEGKGELRRKEVDWKSMMTPLKLELTQQAGEEVFPAVRVLGLMTEDVNLKHNTPATCR